MHSICYITSYSQIFYWNPKGVLFNSDRSTPLLYIDSIDLFHPILNTHELFMFLRAKYAIFHCTVTQSTQFLSEVI